MRNALAAALLAGLSATTSASAMTLQSADLRAGSTIAPPFRYPRCGGQNTSPDLSWHGAPAGTKTYVLTMIDIDVKPSGWSHWILIDLPADTTALNRGTNRLPSGAKAILSNFGDLAYAGPCPPHGTGLHHYRFTIWAMPTVHTEIAPNIDALLLERRLEQTALASGVLIGSVLPQ